MASRDEVSVVLARRAQLVAATALAAAAVALLIAIAEDWHLADRGVVPPRGLPALGAGLAALMAVVVLVGVASGRARDLRSRAGWLVALVVVAALWSYNDGGSDYAGFGAFWACTAASAVLSYVACAVAYDVRRIGS